MATNPRQVSQTRLSNGTLPICIRAYERVVKEIVDKRERITKNLKDEAKTKEELSKRQPQQLLEQNVSSCVKKIVATTRQGNRRVPTLASQRT